MGYHGSLVLTWSAHGFGGIWTQSELVFVKAAFDAWSNVANISFDRIGTATGFRQTPADLAVVATGFRLGQFEDAIGLAYTPDPFFTEFDLMGEHYTQATYPRSQGDIFLDDPESGSYAPGGSDFQTILHEIGHALGFKHPHDQPRSYAQLGISEQDNVYFTVMSYKHPVHFQELDRGWPITPMPNDILAIQHIYGANMSFQAGDDAYVLQHGDGIVRTIWDAGGTDTLDASSSGRRIFLNMQQGQLNHNGANTVTAIAFNVKLENAIGSQFNDVFTGNAADNVLAGMGGNDSLDGGRGADTLQGGSGNDDLFGHEGNDVLTGSSGNDALVGYHGADELDGGSGNDTLRGGTGADFVRGGAGNDQLYGDEGNDTLVGGGGNDTLSGGAGNDVFRFNVAVTLDNSDIISDFAGAGIPVKDVIELNSIVFSVLAPGPLSPDNFVNGVSPADADDYIIHMANGALYYDADGNGSGPAIPFAFLSNSPDTLDASDFVVI